jgi:hypothetical protein
MEELLTDREYELERFPGKGGWTYVALPEIPKDKEAAFGIVKVRGTIDDYVLEGVTLMPLGTGVMIMAVKAEIRKKIGKEEGDKVRVTLYRDNSVYKIPEELKTALQAEHGVYERFLAYRKWEQRMCAQWIFSAKRPETVRERIIKTIGRVQRREKII